MLNTIIHGDCLEVMADIPDGSVDAIICDLPYGSSDCAWDVVIPFASLWKHYERIIRPRGAIVLTASQPFASALVMSNPKWFRYEWIWQKTLAANFAQANKRPLKHHESILIFARGLTTYNPQMQEGKPYRDGVRPRKTGVYREDSPMNMRQAVDNLGTRFPSSVQRFANPNNKTLHPTQKPVALFEYLIRTYTNEGETVLDNTAGSCTTAVAAINTGRKFICIEKELEYVEVGRKRVRDALDRMPLFANAAD